MIEIWERISFKGQDAVSWERSFNAGRTWEEVVWCGGGSRLPFVRLDTDGKWDFEVISKQESAEVKS